MPSDDDAFDELCFYTLAHGEPSFIHQHVVDAFTAQNADERTRAIALTFSLAGLYLHVEKQFTGKQVQHAHMKMARKKERWPNLVLPDERGSIRVREVLAAPPGSMRDQAIHDWSASVWNAFAGNKAIVAALLSRHGIV